MRITTKLILCGCLWPLSACAASASPPTATSPTPPPPLMVDGRPAENSVVMQEHQCYGQKIGFTLESNLTSIRVTSAHIDNKRMTVAQLEEFNQYLSQVKRGYALVYFECALNGGFTLSFTELGTQRLTLYFDTRKTVISAQKSLVPTNKNRPDLMR